ncbi:hypothetical protein Hanom_Chr07g00618041 [Helianthus anomalus]
MRAMRRERDGTEETTAAPPGLVAAAEDKCRCGGGGICSTDFPVSGFEGGFSLVRVCFGDTSGSVPDLVQFRVRDMRSLGSDSGFVCFGFLRVNSQSWSRMVKLGQLRSTCGSDSRFGSVNGSGQPRSTGQSGQPRLNPVNSVDSVNSASQTRSTQLTWST